MAKVETTTNDSDSDDDNEPEWEVTAEGMALRKASYSTYEIEYGGNVQRFKEIRGKDERGYELRGRDTFTVGYFDPTNDAVPAEVATAFRVLESES